MLNPSVAYPTRTSPPSGTLPFGGARDATVANDLTATPYTALILNDIWGLMQAMADAGGVTPNNVNEGVGTSQLLPLLASGGGALAGVVQSSVPVALTAGQVGATVLLSEGAATVALPPAADPPVGGVFRVQTRATTTLSVAGGGTMLVNGVSRTAVELPAGTECICVTSGAAWWVFGTGPALSTLGVVGGLRDLVVSATGSSAQVSVSAAAVALDSTVGAPPMLVKNVALNPSLAASGVNGLDAGSSAQNTWYSVWLISDGTTTAALLSTSATAPTMPTGYTYRRRVGWVRTDSTANKYPLSFIQKGCRAQYVVAAGSNVPSVRAMASGVAGSTSVPTWAPVSTAAFVPPTATEVGISLSVYSGSSAQAFCAPNSSYGSHASTNPPPVSFTQSTGQATGAIPASFILETSSIFWASTSASAILYCTGWSDSL